ncbi:hypothetical protein H2201_002135 [Coniosporium apollinis]|uniref:UBC core domain-containing protein n=2 Tax=Coniosporium TaxID=2810619 RepID=A0ABQ9P202_9PEZI|nr:hypothetical protein H2201_002135 [Coniosporium apollinis]
MPRKAFVADLNQAIEGVHIDGISNVLKGEDDGEFSFEVLPPASRIAYKISALVPELSEYPSGHECHVYVADDNVPASIAACLQDLPSTNGKTIAQLLEIVSRAFARGGETDSDGDLVMRDSQLEEEEESEEEEDEFEEDDYFPDERPAQPSTHGEAAHTVVSKGQSSSTPALRVRIRSDLRTAKEAGFKIGHIGLLLHGSDSCYVSVSCRISKLGISEEAMQAWNIEPTQYLILLIQYPNGYKDLDTLNGYENFVARQYVAMRVGVSSTYKPTMQEAIRAFAKMNKEEKDADSVDRADELTEGFRDVFISQPINALLNERLITLIKYRCMGMSWKGSEDFYNSSQGKNIAHADMMGSTYVAEESTSAEYPTLVMSDHVRDSRMGTAHSFPLIAMQFFLRHFVRCTEFCLVCHCRLEDDLEALKPYVCDKPLCLYQYMSLGFGPSIEHEVLSQPYVVDLLVSFCYTSAKSGQLKDFPQGLSLSVPPVADQRPGYVHPAYHGYGGASVALSAEDGTTTKPIDAQFDRYGLQLSFSDEPVCPVKVGDWVAIRLGSEPIMHCRVSETAYFPTVKVSQPVPANAPEPTTGNAAISVPTPGSSTPSLNTAAAPVPGFSPVGIWIYNANFDGLPEYMKRSSICILLETLPSVRDMAQYLGKYTSASLSTWVDRISPAALSLLRWIIASNRSCIVQIDEPLSVGQSKSDTKLQKTSKTVKETDRLYGMPGWMQFRFAMGAPDKERRFINALKEKTQELNLKHPTLFAWHGSPLGNWHSIIREGLHFNRTVNGRVFGHGVYMSLHHATSLGYAGFHNIQNQWYWPQSQLKMSTAMSLNEVVNAPAQFVSKHPHLVVDKLDWIQTRYLFVQCQQAGALAVETEKKPVQVFEQDPSMTPTGVREGIVIPLTAISPSRRPSVKAVRKGNKKIKSTGTIIDPILLGDDDTSPDDDGKSVATDVEDLEILFDDEPPQPEPFTSTSKGKAPAEAPKRSSIFSLLNPRKSPTAPLTDFIPGTLDHSTITKLAPPAWATTTATKRLQSDFRALLKTQSTTPLHELGWYIDAAAFENVYQWIVELHSFEPHLPLAKDMKAKQITSIVLELRFGKDYPMAPPFVRIIRPRFLGFMQGGGGHVTAGGALCMELLTNNGWSAVSSIESVLLQVRLAMSSLDPKPARLENGPVREYGVGEAVEAFIRACRTHGWTVPEGFAQMAYGGESAAGGR